MSNNFSQDLEELRQQGIPVDQIRLVQLYPFWTDSDPRLAHYTPEISDVTANMLLDNIDNLKARRLLIIMIDGLKVWNEYNELKSQIDEENTLELVKFDAEFRRFIARRENDSYDDDFEDPTVINLEGNKSFDSMFDQDEDQTDQSDFNTFSRGVTLQLEHELYEEDSIEIQVKEPRRKTIPIVQIDPNLIFPEDQFQIVKFLGRGGEGKVFLAVDVTNNNQVALKQYETNLSEKDSLLEVMIKELNMLTKIRHKNIVKYKGLHIPQPEYENIFNCNIVMEYIDQGSVSQLISQQNYLTEQELKRLAWDILSALSYLHSRNVIHRDLKPANILIGECYKLSDFGVSKQIIEQETITRTTVGTPQYMPPEVFFHKPYSYAADIWSFGCLIFEAFTKLKPYGRALIPSLAKLHSKDVTPLAYHKNQVPEMSEDLRSFLQQCWRCPHSMRPSAFELLQHPWLK